MEAEEIIILLKPVGFGDLEEHPATHGYFVGLGKRRVMGDILAPQEPKKSMGISRAYSQPSNFQNRFFSDHEYVATKTRPDRRIKYLLKTDGPVYQNSYRHEP